ncbi:MAG: pyrroline-5-carboxylate reductase [Cyclobacteriaceae bacterium]|nr:MAG: pyrroline-5-carboxylate reductase [Cyclobacteriaceae bacterium]
MKDNIAIIGGGNLGSSIAQGLVKSGYIVPEKVIVTRRKIGRLETLKELGVIITSDNNQAVANARVVIVAVKPHQIDEVLEDIKDAVRSTNALLISVVTGITTAHMKEKVGSEVKLFRVMPNTAIAIQQSMTCISSVNGSLEEIEEVTTLFENMGKVAVIHEELMDAATALGACGIAFALRFIRAAIQGGIEIGFDAKTAELVAAQTAKGAASLVMERKRHPEREIDLVTTPQGCTIAGLNEMEHQGFSSALIKGIVTSFQKI